MKRLCGRSSGIRRQEIDALLRELRVRPSKVAVDEEKLVFSSNGVDETDDEAETDIKNVTPPRRRRRHRRLRRSVDAVGRIRTEQSAHVVVTEVIDLDTCDNGLLATERVHNVVVVEEG